MSTVLHGLRSNMKLNTNIAGLNPPRAVTCHIFFLTEGML